MSKMNLETIEKQVAEDKVEESEKKSKPRVSDKTLKQYLTRVRKIHKLMFNKPMEGINWLKDYKKVIDFILNEPTWKTDQSKSTYINAVASYLRNSKELPAVYQKYSEINKVVANNIQKKKKDNKMTEKENDVLLPWSEILEKTKGITNLEDKALVSVYTLFPPRRIDSYRLMRVFTKRTGMSVPNDDNNYLVLNSKRVPQKFVFQNYKTAKHFGRQEFKLPIALKSILKAYTDRGKKHMSCLFGARNGECLSQPGFTSKVRNVFKKYTDKPLTVNSLRHSYASYINGQNLTLKQREEIGNKMAHSVNMQLEYHRSGLSDEEE